MVTMLTVKEGLRQIKTKKYIYFFHRKEAFIRKMEERWKGVWKESKTKWMVRSGVSEC